MKHQTHHCLTSLQYEEYVKTNLLWNSDGKFLFDINETQKGRLWTLSDLRIRILNEGFTKNNGDNEFSALNNYAKLYDLTGSNADLLNPKFDLYSSTKCPKPPGNPKGPGGIYDPIIAQIRINPNTIEINSLKDIILDIHKNIQFGDISKWKGDIPPHFLNDSPFLNIKRFDVLDFEGNPYPTWTDDGILYQTDLKEHSGTVSGDYLFIIEAHDSKFGNDFIVVDVVSYE